MNVWLVENGDGYRGRIKGTSEQTLRENILAIVDSIEDCKARTTVLSIINYLIQLYKQHQMREAQMHLEQQSVLED